VERTTTKAHLAYQVDDLESWQERFHTIGIETIDGVPISGYDPFGNRIELIQETRNVLDVQVRCGMSRGKSMTRPRLQIGRL